MFPARGTRPKSAMPVRPSLELFALEAVGADLSDQTGHNFDNLDGSAAASDELPAGSARALLQASEPQEECGNGQDELPAGSARALPLQAL